MAGHFKSLRPRGLVCMVCLDSLGERPQCLVESDELINSALACGHLFHLGCIQQWIKAVASAEEDGLVDNREVICPYCQEKLEVAKSIKVYLPWDEEVSNDHDSMRSQNMVLESKLAEEISAHDELKLEYGLALSKIQDLEGKFSEFEQMKLAYENSVKTITEKLEYEKAEALKRTEQLESEVRELSQNLQFQGLTLDAESEESVDYENDVEIRTKGDDLEKASVEVIDISEEYGEGEDQLKYLRDFEEYKKAVENSILKTKSV